mmetsp:Transcript_67741/g.153197  ORF Transcript_67741/g.153197 Transcript_67741/m.153197 type:complete len:251 (-) Transcript_67741:42-794(-)
MPREGTSLVDVHNSKGLEQAGSHSRRTSQEGHPGRQSRAAALCSWSGRSSYIVRGRSRGSNHNSEVLEGGDSAAGLPEVFNDLHAVVVPLAAQVVRIALGVVQRHDLLVLDRSVHQPRVGSGLQQQRQGLDVAVMRSPHQRGHAQRVRQVDVDELLLIGLEVVLNDVEDAVLHMQAETDLLLNNIAVGIPLLLLCHLVSPPIGLLLRREDVVHVIVLAERRGLGHCCGGRRGTAPVKAPRLAGPARLEPK